MKYETASTLRKRARRRFFSRRPTSSAMAFTLPFFGAMLAITWFLLPFFHPESGEVGWRPQDIHLPLAYGAVPLKGGLVVELGPHALRLNGFTEVDSAHLVDDLAALRASYQLLHPGEAMHEAVTLYADRDLAIGEVRRISGILEMEGLGPVQLAVDKPL